jgi:hypothetical protein
LSSEATGRRACGRLCGCFFGVHWLRSLLQIAGNDNVLECCFLMLLLLLFLLLQQERKEPIAIVVLVVLVIMVVARVVASLFPEATAWQ